MEIKRNKIKEDMFYRMGELSLPLPYRVRPYIDSAADEFRDMPYEKKLYHFAFLLSRGFNLYKEICEDIKEHMEVPGYGDYEETAAHTLLNYIELLRSGKLMGTSYLVLENLPLESIVNLLSHELLLRYNEYGDGTYDFDEVYYKYDKIDCSLEYLSTTEETEMNLIFSEEKIKMLNGWKVVAEKIQQYDVFKSWKGELVYPGDETAVHKFNEKANDDCKLQLDLPPCPFTPNILNAKLIILSLNPGYIKLLNRNLPGMLKPSYVEAYQVPMVKALRMEGGAIYSSDVEKIIGENYWAEKLQPIVNECYKNAPEKIYHDVAIMQYLGYTSQYYKDLSKKYSVPSQWFARLFIRYITTQKIDVKFLILRGEDKWRELIDKDSWQLLELSGRLLKRNKPGRNQAITRKNMGNETFDDILMTLDDPMNYMPIL